jgi:hypothetical protein
MPFRSLSVTLAVLIFASSTLFAQLPNTQLSTVTPAGGTAGTTVEVVVAGADQDDLTTLVFSHPGVVATQVVTAAGEFDANPTPVNNKFQVAIAADVPVGIYEVRAAGRFGLSSPRAFVVASREQIIGSGNNHTLGAAQEIQADTDVVGIADAGKRDYYKLNLTAGQRVIVECLAQRLGSRVNSVLTILDDEGRELAQNNDGIGEDSLLDFTATSAGTYTITVRDFVYRGGAEYLYRLVVKSGSHVDFVVPSVGKIGAAADYMIVGRNLPGGKPLADVFVDGIQLEYVTQNIQFPAAGTITASHRTLVEDSISNTNISVLGDKFTFSISDLPVAVESGENDSSETAMKIEVPSVVSGQFYPANDVDWFEFNTTKGQVFVIEVVSHRLGLSVDAIMLVQKVVTADDGKVTVSAVASVDDPSNRNSRIGQEFDATTDDPVYRFTAPEDATYRIRITDQFSRSRNDPRLQYELRIRPEQPQLTLTADLKQIKTANANEIKVFSPILRKSDSLLINVRVQRIEGFSGPVTVTVEGLPAGVTCAGVDLSASQSVASLVLNSTADVKAWQGNIRIMGSAQVGDEQIQVEAQYAAVTWGTANKTQTPAYFQSLSSCLLSVIAVEAGAAVVSVGDGAVLETSRGGKIEIPVKLARGAGFDGDLKLVATNVAAEVKPADITIKKDINELNLVIELKNAKAKAGLYTYYLRGDAKVKRTRNADAILRAEAKLAHIVKMLEAADAALATATETNKTAEGDEAKAKAAAELKVATETQKRTTAAKTASDKALAAVKTADAAKDYLVAVVSTPIRINVVDSPFTIGEVSSQVTAGGEIELKFAIERKYGFVDAVDLTFVIPGSLKGVAVAKIQIAKDASEAIVKLTATAESTAGKHAIEVSAAGKFNAVPVVAKSVFNLEVIAAAKTPDSE